MKTMKIERLLGVFLIAILISMTTAQAQDKDCPHGQKQKMHQKQCDKQGSHGDGANFMVMIKHLPDITEAQQKDLKNLHTKHLKIMMNSKNQLKEKQARLNTLSNADKADMNAINAAVDQVGTIKTQMMKERASFKQEVRKILNEEQRLIFDMHHSNKKGCDRGHRPCRK
ncbi:Spy/CpxP family protein refolding chaperone [candidate division KSB1 bacterium]